MSDYYQNKVASIVAGIKSKNLFRQYPVISLLADKPPYGLLESEGWEVVVWGNNNYLGLSSHPKIIKAKIVAVEKYGTGSGGTRNVLGTSKLVDDLEKKIAKFHNKDRSLLHISALDANIGVLAALAKGFEGMVFISDEHNHASIIDGIKLSAAKKYIFKHNDLADLENKLKEVRAISFDIPIVVVIESIYSMDGDIAPVQKIVELKEKYNALLYVDEVHAIGLYGKNGSGICEELRSADKIDIVCGTFGKALGSSGGYVAASENMIEFLRHFSRNFIFTTAPSADNAAAAIAAIDILLSEEGKELRRRHASAVALLKAEFRKKSINYIENNTHIIPVIIGDEEKASFVSRELLYKYNIAVTPIFSPTVPIGQARIRINPTPYHTENMCVEMAEALKKLL